MLLAVAAMGTVPSLLHATRMYRSNRRRAGVLIGDVSTGVAPSRTRGAGFDPHWSWLCLCWAAAVALLGVPASRRADADLPPSGRPGGLVPTG